MKSVCLAYEKMLAEQERAEQLIVNATLVERPISDPLAPSL